jgi:hypothetical protein
MKFSHQILKRLAVNGGRNASTTMPIRPLGLLTGRSLLSSPMMMQHHRTPHCQLFHSTSTSYHEGTGTQHHIIPSADENNLITNDPSTVKRNFRIRLSQTKHSSQIGGGNTRIEKQHAKGSLTARERIGLLFDGGSFREVDALVTHRCSEFDMDKNVIPGDGVVVGKLTQKHTHSLLVDD